MFGIDCAAVDGNKRVNWQQARAAGVTFAILRCSYSTDADKFYAAERERVRAAGIVLGGYVFPVFPSVKHPKVPSRAAQIDVAIDAIDWQSGDLPISLDIEFPGKGAVETGMMASELLVEVFDMATHLRDHLGYWPMLYTSGCVWDEDLANLKAPELLDCPLWLARYPFSSGKTAVTDAAQINAARAAVLKKKGGNIPDVPKPWGDQDDWWIWQYQGDAQLPVIGQVDMNRFNTMLPGVKGARVKWVQRKLGLRPGIYDKTMEAAVRIYQAENGLVVDGIIGPRTFAAMATDR